MSFNKKFGALLFIWFLAKVFSVIENFYWLRGVEDLRPPSQIIISGFLQFVAGIIVIYILLKLIERYKYSFRDLPLQISLHVLNISLLFVLTFTVAILTFAIFEQIRTLNQFFLVLNDVLNQSYLGFIKASVSSYFLMSIAAYSIHFYDKTRVQKLENLELQSKYLETKLEGLRSQLNPHLLFNSLNTVVSLIDSNPKQAKDMVVDLSYLLRRLLETSNKKFVTIEEELSFLKRYLDIEKTRFSDSLMINIEVDQHLKERLIPNLLLQPIVENSLIHGFNKSRAGIFNIEVRIASLSPTMIQIIIADNGIANITKDSIKPGIGLTNVLTRLKAIYENEFIFKIDSGKSGVKTEIHIPIIDGNKGRI
ncbi:MAG: histidine kinase [Balneolaceae bacterium]|nr:histidine kinase [Balneolaceae bacterium]MBO6547018.1 histidine kinase [Balneolaceae bacterium]MBO6648035.1 histidine kinase [Balneolaceae bacterium]